MYKKMKEIAQNVQI